jgi:hypothetical protein
VEEDFDVELEGDGELSDVSWFVADGEGLLGVAFYGG